MRRRNVAWGRIEEKHERWPEERFRRWVERRLRFPAAVRAGSAERWQQMTDAEVAEAVGMTEDEVRELEERCAPQRGDEDEGSAT